MFNIYYINYAKAYEIAMLLDNKILEQIKKEKTSVFSLISAMLRAFPIHKKDKGRNCPKVFVF